MIAGMFIAIGTTVTIIALGRFLGRVASLLPAPAPVGENDELPPKITT